MLNKILALLKGKKTYIIGILMIALGILQDNNQMILEGLGFVFLRVGVAGIAK